MAPKLMLLAAAMMGAAQAAKLEFKNAGEGGSETSLELKEDSATLECSGGFKATELTCADSGTDLCAGGGASSAQSGPVFTFRDTHSSKFQCSAETGADGQAITNNGWASNTCTCNQHGCDNCFFHHMQTNIDYRSDTRYRFDFQGYDYETQRPISAYTVGYLWGGETDTVDCAMHKSYGSGTNSAVTISEYCAPGPCASGRCLYLKLSVNAAACPAPQRAPPPRSCSRPHETCPHPPVARAGHRPLQHVVQHVHADGQDVLGRGTRGQDHEHHQLQAVGQRLQQPLVLVGAAVSRVAGDPLRIQLMADQGSHGSIDQWQHPASPAPSPSMTITVRSVLPSA